MLVIELISLLQTMPQHYSVEINDNRNGRVFEIDQVDCFTEADFPTGESPYLGVMIQVNC